MSDSEPNNLYSNEDSQNFLYFHFHLALAIWCNVHGTCAHGPISWSWLAILLISSWLVTVEWVGRLMPLMFMARITPSCHQYWEGRTCTMSFEFWQSWFLCLINYPGQQQIKNRWMHSIHTRLPLSYQSLGVYPPCMTNEFTLALLVLF